MATIEDETEGLGAMTQEQIGGLLAGFLAAHAVGITDAMVTGHQMVGDGVGVSWELIGVQLFSWELGGIEN